MTSGGHASAIGPACKWLNTPLPPDSVTTVREKEVLELVREGLTNREIAARLTSPPGQYALTSNTPSRSSAFTLAPPHWPAPSAKPPSSAIAHPLWRHCGTLAQVRAASFGLAALTGWADGLLAVILSRARRRFDCYRPRGGHCRRDSALCSRVGSSRRRRDGVRR